jgi:hypothetical protein
LRSIQKVRTPHGTRVARRITCTVCGAGDTIDFAPRDPSEVLCRKCAFAKRGVIDPDDAACAAMRQHFDDRQLVELTVLISAYNMHTRVARALRIDIEGAPAAAR